MDAADSEEIGEDARDIPDVCEREGSNDSAVMFFCFAGVGYLVFAPLMIAGLINGSTLGVTMTVLATVGWLSSAAWLTIAIRN